MSEKPSEDSIRKLFDKTIEDYDSDDLDVLFEERGRLVEEAGQHLDTYLNNPMLPLAIRALARYFSCMADYFTLLAAEADLRGEASDSDQLLDAAYMMARGEIPRPYK